MTVYAFFFLFLARVPIFLAEPNHFSNFDKGALEEHFSKIILKSGPWPKRRWCLNAFIFIISSGGHFV